jgi:hypothetical protein
LKQPAARISAVVFNSPRAMSFLGSSKRANVKLELARPTVP